MDVQVVKDATPQVQLVNGQADIAYTVRVRNNGPNQAHDVKLVDAAPSGVTFTGITQQPVDGSCSLSGGVLLQCSLGTLGPGVERTIGLSARVTQTGTYVNCATGTGNGKDTNGANNMELRVDARHRSGDAADATPKPPVKPKPKPKPAVNICRVLKVTPKMVKANGDQADRAREGDALAHPGAGRRGAVHGHRPREGRHDEQAGHCPPDAHAEQGGDHARQDHEREGVQQRPDRRGRRLRAAGDGLGDSPSRHSVGAPGLARGRRRLGERLAGPQGPVGLSRGWAPQDLDPGGG